ncbi:MAG: DNA primase [Candidatus Pacearchaeota archaeon]|nr:MAG: DNA primase [Candidatus Pacearchaeota archaeon]
MGKVSPPSIKYIINAQFFAEGVIEKPDVIGAIFGQTEGLLGEELELRELQKRGKIGRIDASLDVKESKTTGKIEIPTSMDKAETTIIAAAIETIDRIGPCDARFEINSIEDVRSSKREYIIERAKKLLEKFNGEMPELKEIEKDIINHSRTSRIKEYGRELLPAGPNIEKSDEIIVVEGRADVLNLLRYGIKNTIAMNGTMIPRTIKDLSKEKKTILFVDGDRGGVLIATDAVSNANISSIARAPDGKEVEELTEKEVIICLRNSMSTEDFLERYKNGGKRYGKKITRTVREMREMKKETKKEQIIKKELTEEEKETLKNYLEDIEGTKNVLLVDNDLKIIKKVSSNDIVRTLYIFRRRNKQVFALVMDTIVTPSIVNIAEKINCQYIVARNFATTSDKIKLLSF